MKHPVGQSHPCNYPVDVSDIEIQIERERERDIVMEIVITAVMFPAIITATSGSYVLWLF